MQVLIEFLPLLAFLVAYKTADIYVATATLMAAMVCLLVYDRWKLARIPPLHLASAALVFVLGTATLLLHDKRFIVWKPTFLFWALAAACVVSVVMQKPLIERLMMAASTDSFSGIGARDWNFVTLLWAIFYASMGALNLWIAWTYSEATWVNFKVYGITGLSFIFVIAQTFWLASRSAQSSRSEGAQ